MISDFLYVNWKHVSPKVSNCIFDPERTWSNWWWWWWPFARGKKRCTTLWHCSEEKALAGHKWIHSSVVNTRTSVASIPLRVRLKILMFSLARCSENPYICYSCFLHARLWILNQYYMNILFRLYVEKYSSARKIHKFAAQARSMLKNLLFVHSLVFVRLFVFFIIWRILG